MKSYEAVQRSIAGKTVAHAKALHLSTSSVSKWQEPAIDFSDSGSFNPLDRIETIMQTSLHLGTPREDALAPIHYLAHRFHGLFIPLPDHSPSLKNLQVQLSTTVKEFGHLLERSYEAMEDGIITGDERKRIDREGQHLMHHLCCYLQLVKEASER
ncbi:MAG: hypothetical protein C5B59_01440 [Bacteroidetes bacterium]|nr:MAG: hypothetical protein C5B59_01440 [Bacteroidota bacterium]